VLLSSEIEFDISRVRDLAIPLETYQEHIKTRPSDAAVTTSTPNGTIGGTLSGTPSFVRLPGSKVFQKVYTAMLNSPPLAGDCGSWVKHAVSGKLFGHVIAGSLTTGLVLVMPAVKVFAEALAVLSDQEVRLQQVKLIPRLGLRPFLNSRIEMACDEFVGNLGDDAGQSNRELDHEGLFGMANDFGTIRATPPPRRPSHSRLIPPYVPPPPGYVGSPSLRIFGQPSSPTQQDATSSTPAAARPKNLVTIADIRKEVALTAQKARESLSSYFVFRFEKFQTTDFDSDGFWQTPSWKRALRMEVPGISKQEAARTVRQLNRTTIPVTDKMQSLGEDAKRQIEITLENLQRKHDNTSFQTTLAQLDEEMGEAPKEESLREQDRRKEWYPKEFGLLDTSPRRKEPSKSRDRGRATMERISLTAYFKREPRPDVDPFPLLHFRNNQGGSAQNRIPYAHSVTPLEDEVHPPLSAVDAGLSSPVAQGGIAFSRPEGPAHDWSLPKSSSQPPPSHTPAPIRIWPPRVDAAALAPPRPPEEPSPSTEQLGESTLLPLAPADSTVPLAGPSMLLSTRESRDSGYSDGAEDKTAIGEQTTEDFAKCWKEELPGSHLDKTTGAEQTAGAFAGYWKDPLPGWHLPFDAEEPDESSGEVKMVVNEGRKRCMSVSSDLGGGESVWEYLAKRAEATK
jgi:hypothetical protein